MDSLTCNAHHIAIAILEMCKSKSKIASSIFYYRFAKNYRHIVLVVLCVAVLVSSQFSFNMCTKRYVAVCCIEFTAAAAVAAAFDAKVHDSIIKLRMRCEN